MSGYVVIEYNQASSQPYGVHGPFADREEAELEADYLRELTADVGRLERFTVAELVEVES